MLRACFFLLPFILLSLPPIPCPAADDFLEVTESLKLDPNKFYPRLIIKKSGITIDGQGTILKPGESRPSNKREGTAIIAEGISDVTLRNISASGWETGLKLVGGSNWTIENCDFSDNFHDPAFGWGENGRRGGIVLDGVHKSRLIRNHCNRVWDGCVLVNSDDNLLEANDFSRTSNTCLKLWNSSRNTIRDNRLSYGIRKDPGEVHARDSTSVLIESGSNENHFLRNDCTHGGDGIFVRVLNGWVSSGNIFEANDCSYANNNCIEAWAPRNTYIRNKANHGSYGFWLGASDQTVLIDNEASFNGLPSGNHNSPHLPDKGHAGIVFMFGPSSHTICRGNSCVGNNGAGIAAIGDQGSKGEKWKAFHWIIEQNWLEENRWGLFLEHADWLDIGSNLFRGNTLEDIHTGPNVHRLTQRPPVSGVLLPPKLQLTAPSSALVGQEIEFDASASLDPAGHPLKFQWDFGTAVSSDSSKPRITFREPGFYRIGVTVHNGALSDLGYRDFYVVDPVPEIGTETGLEAWSWEDPQSKCEFTADSVHKIQGSQSLRALASPYGGGRLTLRYLLPNDAPTHSEKSRLVFWLRTRNENIPAWQDLNPLVTLTGNDEDQLTLTPARDFLSQPPYNEARDGWTRFEIPLAGNIDWQSSGKRPSQLHEIRRGFDSWGAPPLTIWIDGLSLK